MKRAGLKYRKDLRGWAGRSAFSYTDNGVVEDFEQGREMREMNNFSVLDGAIDERVVGDEKGTREDVAR